MVWVEKVGIGIGSGGERKPVNVITYGGCCGDSNGRIRIRM